ncbi:hypothetical protein C2845_PM05G19520 [Panicum miliaceum]|uniref:Uncharacterized protein n=1 Tax=Panicum miliaceum TaxID=4540 RepID=A0A3L6STB6_PANMI|nr:hypothetical protein C2845_PM05G19520 [Panicum miliaceum]
MGEPLMWPELVEILPSRMRELHRWSKVQECRRRGYYNVGFMDPNVIQEKSIFRMKEDLIEPERVRTVQEEICGFLLDEVINPKIEFYADHRISVARLDPNRDDNNDG